MAETVTDLQEISSKKPRRNRSQRELREKMSFYLLPEFNLFTQSYSNKDYLWGVRLERAGTAFTDYLKHSRIVGMFYNLCRLQKYKAVATMNNEDTCICGVGVGEG